MTSESIFHSASYRENDPTNETVEFCYGWLGLERGYFCRVSMDGLCVEHFAHTKRGSLRLARRAWRKNKDKSNQDMYGYPRICEKKS